MCVCVNHFQSRPCSFFPAHSCKQDTFDVNVQNIYQTRRRCCVTCFKLQTTVSQSWTRHAQAARGVASLSQSARKEDSMERAPLPGCPLHVPSLGEQMWRLYLISWLPASPLPDFPLHCAASIHLRRHAWNPQRGCPPPAPTWRTYVLTWPRNRIRHMCMIGELILVWVIGQSYRLGEWVG